MRHAFTSGLAIAVAIGLATTALAQPAANAGIAVQQGSQASALASGSAAHSLAASG